jgi:sulfatase maturation enzyme AslB (radical SAM superfamily)
MSADIAKKAIDFFFPYLAQECTFNFYGGEPLLAYDLMHNLVSHIEMLNATQNKNIHYAITTNGSLIDQDILLFFDAKKFSVLFSFDGTVQNLCRELESFAPLVSTLKRFQEFSGIDLATNSVFTPKTIGGLSDSVCFLLDEGIPLIELSFSSLTPWDESSISVLQHELGSVRKILSDVYRRTRTIPVSNFMRPRRAGLFRCSAGEDRLALSPEGYLWGCCFFYDLVRRREDPGEKSKYCFGSLRSFMKNPEEIYLMRMEDYRNLNMDYFFTKKGFCQLCEHITGCVVCPVDAAFASSVVGMIPVWVCQVREVIHQERRRFWEDENGGSLQF